MSVGDNIKNRRKELGMNAEKLAEKIGISASTVYRYESGDIEKIDSAKLIPIAEALGTTPAALMGWEDSEPEHTAPQQERKWKMLSSGFLALTDEELDKIWDMAHLMYPETIPERKD